LLGLVIKCVTKLATKYKMDFKQYSFPCLRAILKKFANKDKKIVELLQQALDALALQNSQTAVSASNMVFKSIYYSTDMAKLPFLICRSVKCLTIQERREAVRGLFLQIEKTKQSKENLQKLGHCFLEVSLFAHCMPQHLPCLLDSM